VSHTHALFHLQYLDYKKPMTIYEESLLLLKCDFAYKFLGHLIFFLAACNGIVLEFFNRFSSA